MEKILIIDDDVTFSLMLRTWLGKKGFGVDTAADIAAGRRLLAEGSYDLVLSDMRLPDGDGTDLLQWIAERGVTIPVIVMTGYAEIRNAVVSMKLGARDYVSKPVQPDELPAELSEAVPAPIAVREPAGEEERIRRALAAAGGNKSQAARLLGIDRKTLYNKLHLYGIE